ncbi:MAG: glycosyltransferase [Pirellulaceae bacterium]|nr:glycosyltransferase [Pirellulaceae bacterium]
MAHYAIVCPDDAGGFLPIGSVGHEFVRRGHRVTLVARPKCAPLAGRLDLPFHALEADEIAKPFTPLKWLAFRAVNADWVVNMRNWFRWYTELTLHTLPGALRDLGVDCVLVHQNVAAGGTAAERLGIPFITVCSSLPWHEDPDVPPLFTSWLPSDTDAARLRNRLAYASRRWFNRPMLDAINRCRRNWKFAPLARIEDGFSPWAQVWQLCPDFDFPRPNLLPHAHYIGSLGTGRAEAADSGFPWGSLDGRPLIFASLGTVPARANLPVFRKILEACAPLDAQVVLALGKWYDEHNADRGKLEPVPENAVVVDFAPQLALLDKADLLITHAGVNTVLEAICRGVPMVALPRGGDQPGMGARIEYSGVGLRASFQRCTSEQLREMVQRVMSDESYRRRARELQQAMVAAGGAAKVVDIAEQVVSTGRPVLRPM